ncbi:MAG: hypothetical protein R3336_10245, partial [Phycisphaeraceae bacterium]|nr:hypothetical protein [Phycisphaeraceae bacterium]
MIDHHSLPSCFTRLLAPVALVASLMTAGPAFASEREVTQALNMVPADTDLVILVPNMTRLNQNVSAFNDRFNFNVPQMADIVGEFQRVSGFVDGVRRDGAWLLIANMKPDQATVPLMLVAMEDYDQFRGNFKTGETADGITPIEISGGWTGYARSLGPYALLGRDRQAMASYQPSRSGPEMLREIGALGRRYAAEADLIAMLDVGVIRPALKQLAQTSRELTNDEDAAPALPTDTPPTLEAPALATAMPPMLESAISAIERDGTRLMFCAHVGSEGPALTTSVGLKPDSPLDQMFQGGEAERNLTRLPD